MANTKKHQFGTFAGVFTPSILTILGVIMFMRTGFVIGQAGINMPGGLKNPSRSLVRGTFLAVAAGATVYGLQIVLSGGEKAMVRLC